MLTRKRINQALDATPEKWLAGVWRRQWLDSGLTTVEGSRLEVIYPGYETGGPGPDFRDAAIVIAGRRLTGDVEVHVRSGDWEAHGHARDGTYSRTILHVVLIGDAAGAPITRDGRAVPELRIAPYVRHGTFQAIPRPAGIRFLLPCAGRIPAVVLSLLNSAGRARLTAKAAALEEAMTGEPPGDVLFQAIARALGYARNTAPFAQLAGAVRLRWIDDLNPRSGIKVRQAWLLGAAGLLPSQRAAPPECRDREAEELEKMWKATHFMPILDESRWCRDGLRPRNHPARRLAALGALLRRYQGRGLMPGLLEAVARAAWTGPGHLERALIVPGHGYWAWHYDFGRPLPHASALIGAERALQIASNAVLPFAIARGRLGGEPSLVEAAIAVCGAYPPLERNEITRYMGGVLGCPAASALQQQGAIHLYREHCREKLCWQCPARG